MSNNNSKRKTHPEVIITKSKKPNSDYGSNSDNDFEEGEIRFAKEDGQYHKPSAPAFYHWGNKKWYIMDDKRNNHPDNSKNIEYLKATKELKARSNIINNNVKNLFIK